MQIRIVGLCCNNYLLQVYILYFKSKIFFIKSKLFLDTMSKLLLNFMVKTSAWGWLKLRAFMLGVLALTDPFQSRYPLSLGVLTHFVLCGIWRTYDIAN